MIATSDQRAAEPADTTSGQNGSRASTFTAAVAIGGPIAALFALVALLSFAFFRAVALDHDATSRAADVSAMERSLAAAVEAQKAVTRDYANWDESFENTTLRWNADFVRENFYSDLTDSFVIASADFEIRYQWSHPRDGAKGTERIAASMAVLPKRLTREDFLVGNTQGVAARSYLGLFNGSPLIVTVLPIHPETPSLLDQMGSRPSTDFLIASRTLGLPELAVIGGQIGLSDFSFTARPDPDPGRASHALDQPGAAPIGYVSWLDRRPGTNSFNRHVGWLLLGFALLSALAAIAISRSVKNNLRASEAARLAAEAAQLEAERASAAKSRFLATMSHELRTPLNSIIGYSEVLAESAVEDNREVDAKDAGRIVTAGHHLLTLINQILDHAAIEADAITLSCSALDVADIAADVVAMIDPTARANGTKLDLVNTGSAATALGDPMRLRQCLLNVIGNAVKFTPAGTVRVECRHARIDGRDWAQFSVSDTGIGMSPETLARLFTPFMQADGSHARQFEGTGLGLAITKRLIEAMNGQIDIASSAGAGTTVSLRLPLLIDEEIAAAA